MVLFIAIRGDPVYDSNAYWVKNSLSSVFLILRPFAGDRGEISWLGYFADRVSLGEPAAFMGFVGGPIAFAYKFHGERLFSPKGQGMLVALLGVSGLGCHGLWLGCCFRAFWPGPLCGESKGFYLAVGGPTFGRRQRFFSWFVGAPLKPFCLAV